jgi:hypothetical protein
MTIFIILLVVSSPAWADSDVGGHGASIEDVLGEIRLELDLQKGERIDPDEVPPELLEELGDAVMAEMHPDPENHEWMDRMMGGEGSESLSSAHRWMGYRYLAGGYGRGSGMMGGGMMGPGMMGRWGMMGNPRVPYESQPYESPEDIVKRRYARGEITRQQYLEMLRDLEQADSRR